MAFSPGPSSCRGKPKVRHPYTTPSYAAQFTGLYPEVFHSAGIKVDWGDMIPYFVPGERWTLAERLAAAGYRTAAFIDNPICDERFGFGQGFEHFDRTVADIDPAEQDGGIRHILPRATAWLDGLAPDEPFFLFVQAFDCHSPYTPPETFAGRFGNDNLHDVERVEPVGYRKVVYGFLPAYPVRLLSGEDRPTHARTAPLIAAYDEEILDVDDAVGALLSALRERGLFDEAIVVFAADHGESMLEHDWFFKHGQHHEEVLHVPLVVRLPEGRHGGRRVAESVQLVDLFPTLVELAGLELDATGLHGRSLASFLAGKTPPPVPMLSGRGVQNGFALSYDGWKLLETRPGGAPLPLLLTHPRAREWLAREFGIDPDLPLERILNLAAHFADPEATLDALQAALAGPFHELYHLDSDPLEQHDLAVDEPEMLGRMRALLGRERERVETARKLPASAPGEDASGVLDDLRALGYVDDR